MWYIIDNDKRKQLVFIHGYPIYGYDRVDHQYPVLS